MEHLRGFDVLITGAKNAHNELKVNQEQQ